MFQNTPSAGSVQDTASHALACTPLPMVGTCGSTTRSFKKCVLPQKQLSPKQIRA